MRGKEIIIRRATADDAAEILDIYSYYVVNTAISFEYDVPSLEEFSSRITHTIKKYPYIVAVADSVSSAREEAGDATRRHIVGYAYTGAFVGRKAYDWACETTIYLRHDLQRMGLGGKLYRAIEEISKAQRIINLNACIGYPEKDDEHLTKNSVLFHEHLGYRLVGRFHKCGYKFGKWYDMVWMEKCLTTHPDHPEPVIPFPDIDLSTIIGRT